MTRRITFSIGVSDAPPLPYLAGALNGARDFAAWGRALGYETVLVTDEAEAVTLPRLRDEIEKALRASTDPIHRIVIYFAGHGLIREAEEGLWLLSDWRDELRAVAIEVLKRRLYMYGVEQIAIFADACRSLPADVSQADLVADAVLGRGPKLAPVQPSIDKFIAAQDGAAAYMVPGADPEQDRCLFSGVLIEGLWGLHAQAYSTLVQGKITSRSLAAFLKSEVPRRAALYQRTLNPTVIASFPDGDDYYFDQQAGPAAPAFPPWPAPGTVAGTGTGMGAGMGTAMPAIDAYVDIVGDAPAWHRPVTKDGVTHAGRITELSGTAGEEKGAAAGRVDGQTGHAAAREQTLRARMAQGRGSPIAGSAAGFAVDGAKIQAVWAPRGVRAVRQDARTGLWRVEREDGQPLQATAPVLVQFADGLFAALAIMPRFVASLFRDARGVAAIVYRNVDAPDETIDTTEALARLDSGALRADVVIDLAVMLRQAKHADPVLGVISAYLYDAIGDLESIRRMAYFYVYHGQPIPYDIALLAQLPGRRQGEGLWAEVPALPRRAPRSDAESRNNWTYAAAPAVGGPVGGLWPWMRQGWVFLDHPDDSGSNLILPGLIELRSGMTGSRFATFDAKTGAALAQRFGLEQDS